MTTANDVAEWLIEHIFDKRTVYQEDAVYRIEKQFGPKWVYENENGNPAINKTALSSFRKLHEGTIEWDRGDRSWTARRT